MKLLHCHINAFGKLQDFDMDFEQSLNTICQKNGYGKTTLSIFLKAMFYGMPKKGNNKAHQAERSKYMPWEGSAYGGWLTFENDGKIFKVVRTFGATPEGDTFQLIDQQTGLVSQDFSKDLGSELFGVGSETFAITAFFAQDGLRGEVNDELRASLTGANKFEFDLSNCSKAEKIVSAALTQAKSNCPKAAQIDELKRAKREAENLLAQKESALCEKQKTFAQISQKHQALAAQQKEIEKAYRQSLADKEKASLLRGQLDAKLQQKNALLQQKNSLANAGTIAPTKKSNNKPLLFAFLALMLLGVAAICISFFVGLKIVLLIAGIVLVVVGLAIVGVFVFKQVEKNQRFAAEQQEALALQVKLSAYDTQIAGVEKEILSLQRQIEDLPQIDKTDFEEKLSALHDLDKQKSVLKVEIEAAQNFLQNQQEILTKIEIDLENMAELREKMLARIELLQKTKEFMLQAKANVSERYLQPMQQAFESLFSRFDADEKLALDVNLNINQVTNFGLKETQYLSQGVQDLLSICRRFALLDKIFEKSKPFVVLDDPFVNLDDKKLQAAQHLVQDFAKEFQIIYFCSHTRSKI